MSVQGTFEFEHFDAKFAELVVLLVFVLSTLSSRGEDELAARVLDDLLSSE